MKYVKKMFKLLNIIDQFVYARKIAFMINFKREKSRYSRYNQVISAKIEKLLKVRVC